MGADRLLWLLRGPGEAEASLINRPRECVRPVPTLGPPFHPAPGEEIGRRISRLAVRGRSWGPLSPPEEKVPVALGGSRSFRVAGLIPLKPPSPPAVDLT